MGLGSRIIAGFQKIMQTQSLPPPRSSQNNSMNVHQIQYALQPQGGFSQPVWSPELSTVGAYSREGYTSRTFDTPTVPFSVQVEAMRKDEDVQLAINHLSSQITGGEHYWKSSSELFTESMSRFTKDIDFDWFDTILIKELLAFGNSCWRARSGIKNIRGREDLACIPISSFVRVWWDRQRRPYKYEFRGSQWQGYHNPEDVIPFVWNPINDSAFGTGFLTALTATRPFIEVSPDGTVDKELPSLLDRKYSTALTMHITERRYMPHNVYEAKEASQPERDQLAGDLRDLQQGQDFVVGSKIEIKELGSSQRAFDPSQFTDLTQSKIMAALNDFIGKQGGESQHSYANAKTSAMLTVVGLASFPLAVTRQLIDKLFQPWYEANGGIYDPMYGGGMVSVPWEECKPELNFGRVEKKDLETADAIKLIEVAISSGAVNDPEELRELIEDAGLGLRKEYTDKMQQQYNPDPSQVVPPDFQQAEPTPEDMWWATMGTPPMDDPNWASSYKDFAPEPIKSMDATWGNAYGPNINSQPSDPRINFTSKFATKKFKGIGPKSTSRLRNPKVRGFKSLKIGDINAWLASTDQEG